MRVYLSGPMSGIADNNQSWQVRPLEKGWRS